ncbi:MAG: peptide MFS transporter [Micromonosporaceae bacterium]
MTATTEHPATPPPAVRPDEPESVWSFFANSRFTTLFATDMWERFSFYGLQALIFLYAVAPQSAGGLGLSPGSGGALFGLYMASMLMASLPGGWIGDRILGPRRAVLWGGVVIAIGHYCMAIPSVPTFYLGLACVAAGTGLLKPNMMALVTLLYPNVSSARREACFAFLYMSSMVSALLAPLITGFLGEKIEWHLGFGAAAVGMTIALVWYASGIRRYGSLGGTPPNPASAAERDRIVRRAGLALGLVGVLVTADALAGTFQVEHLLAVVGLTAIVAPVAYFRYLLRRPAFTATDRRRIRGYLWVLGPSALFWMLFSQLGSSFAYFAREHTDRDVFGFLVPASWFQSAHPLFLLLVAPLSAWLWIKLGSRAGAPVKLAGGLLSSAAGFGIMVAAAVLASSGVPVSPWWLIVAFLAKACGEITFGPVGLNVSGEVAPKGYGGQLMGLYFLGAALGAGLGAQYSRLLGVLPLPVYFGIFAVASLAVGVLLAARSGAVLQTLSGDPAPRTITSNI